MNDNRSSKEIERDLEEQREGLADSLDDLKEKFSVDTIVREAATQIREHSGDIGASVTRAVKENPLGVALTGVGLAWLIFGERRTPSNGRDYDTYRRDRAEYGPDHDPYGAYASQRDPIGAGARYSQRSVRDTSTPSWARGVDETHDHDDHEDRGSRMEGMKENVQGRAEAVRHRAAALRDRLSEGTEHFSDEGRARVLDARERAYKAHQATMSRMSDARDKAVDLFEEQPLIAGGLALAVGAAIGAALPHTRMEDEYFGDTADELMREAERIYGEEREKLGSIAQQAVKDVGDVVEKAGSDAMDTVKSDAEKKAPSGQKEDMTKMAGKSALQDDGTPSAGTRKNLPGDIPS
jgi:ElaB/YqjD/DUF883 family membrane-anchored ribosome-binding protein